MNFFTYNDKKIIKVMDEKLTFIMDIIEDETDKDLYFFDYLKFWQLLDLVKDFEQTWNLIKKDSDDIEHIDFILSLIHKVIERNKKVCDESIL